MAPRCERATRVPSASSLPVFADTPPSHDDEETDFEEIKVTTHPSFGSGPTLLTWIVDERPKVQISTGMSIKLTSASRTTGVGRVSGVVDLRRHWVTFKLQGAQSPCSLQVPIPWAKLPVFESYTHTKHYFQLPVRPHAHIQYRYNPIFYDVAQNPYEFDLWDVDEVELDERIDAITNARQRWRA